MSNRNNRKKAILKIILWNLIPIILATGVISWFYWSDSKEKAKEITTLTATIADIDEQRIQLEEHIKEKEEKITELKAALATETEEREKIEQQLEELEKEKVIIEEKLEYVKSLTAGTIGFLEKERDRKEEELRNKSGEIARLEGQGEELAQSVRNKEQLISDHTSEIRLLKKEIQVLQQQEQEYHSTVEIAKKLALVLHQVSLKDKKTEATRKERKAESIAIEFGLDYYRIEELKGRIFAAEIYDTKTGKPLALGEAPTQGNNSRMFFSYTGGRVKLNFITKERKDRDANFALRLYYFPTATSIDEAQKSDFDIQIREPLFLRASQSEKSPKVIPVEKLYRK